jgi:HPt (histidine-containing phosphotransfer) domain-containing protein
MRDDPAPASGPIDWQHLRRYTCGDARLEHEILSLFVAHGPQTLDALHRAQDGGHWAAAAHGLKGSARAVGAMAVADLAAEAEQTQFSETDRRQAQLVALGAALADVEACVGALEDGARKATAT